MAYALGLFYTDGCLHTKIGPNGSWRISFGNNDRATVKWWHQFLQNRTKINVRKRQGSQVCSYTSTAISDVLGNRLLQLGAEPRKSWKEMHIPCMPAKFFPHFIRGVLDGDGGIWAGKSRSCKGGKYLHVSLASNSEVFRTELHTAFLKMNMYSNKDRKDIRFSGSNAEKFCMWVYGVQGQKMSRKYRMWKKWEAFRASVGGLISEYNSHTSCGFHKRKWHSLCGTLPDPEVARIIKGTTQQVYYARRKLGVPPFDVKCKRNSELIVRV